MRKKILAILSAAAILFTLGGPAVAPVGAVSTCSGRPGITLYEHSKYNADIPGAKITFCGALPPAWGPVFDTYLPDNTAGLSWGANWNDRASSIKVFNIPSGGGGFRVYDLAGCTGNIKITITGSTNVPDLGAYWSGNFNDAVSSFCSFY